MNKIDALDRFINSMQLTIPTLSSMSSVAEEPNMLLFLVNFINVMNRPRPQEFFVKYFEESFRLYDDLRTRVGAFLHADQIAEAIQEIQHFIPNFSRTLQEYRDILANLRRLQFNLYAPNQPNSSENNLAMYAAMHHHSSSELSHDFIPATKLEEYIRFLQQHRHFLEKLFWPQYDFQNHLDMLQQIQHRSLLTVSLRRDSHM